MVLAPTVRQAWRLRFGMTDRQEDGLTDELMKQLSQCKSDEARRLILGRSEQYKEGENREI